MLTVLGGQTRHPDAVVGVDAASSDASGVILAESLGPDRVVTLPRDAQPPAFGDAIAAGLASGVLRSDTDETFDGEAVEWVWLLHDDSAPAPDCLDQLLRAADEHPRAVILGPKSLGWHDRRLLLEVGFTVAGSGRRVTGLERREHDQGQHDERSEVHAVGSAGMLVRRDVWESLGGMDPALPLYRDDLDLCWRAWRAGHEVRVVPAAVVHHREASFHGRREGSEAPGRGHRLDRRSALHVLLTQTPAWRVPFTAIRLTVGSIVRALVYLLGKDLRRAGDELLACGSFIAHPGRLAASRKRAAATSSMTSHEAVGEFRPRALSQVRAALEAFGGILSSGRSTGASAGGAMESGPISEDADMFEDPAGGVLRRLLGRPSVLIVLALVVVALVAGRSLWWGDGALFGGALLPAPDGAADLWGSYIEAWHDVGPGSTTPSAPLTAILAALSTVLLGKAPIAVALLLALAVPLSGLTAWWALRGVIVGTATRVWSAVAYALLPAIAGAIAGGRLGAALAAILLPLAARQVVRALGLGGSLPAPTGRTAWGAGLLIAIVVASAPVTWVVVVLAVVVGVVITLRAAGPVGVVAARGVVLLVVPLLLLLPWSFYLVSNPTLLLGDAAGAGLTDPAPSALDILLMHPGGPGLVPAWATAGLVIAALLAPLRESRRPLILASWAVAIVALALGIAASKVLVSVPGVPAPQGIWPGIATLILGGALILAVAVAGDGARASMAYSTFGWRQPAALLATGLALVTPVACAAFWLPGAGDPLRRGDPAVLPPFVVAEAIGPQAPRTLILRESAAGSVAYTLINGTGPSLGDAEVQPPAEVWVPVDALVSGLVSGRGGNEAEGLARYAVRYVVLDRQSGDATMSSLVRTLDSVTGLRRLAGQEGEVLWKVDGDTSRVLQSSADDVSSVPVIDVASADPFVAGPLPLGGAGALSLAQTSDQGWRATIAGAPLAAVDGDLQSFEVPASAGAQDDVVVEFDGGWRARWLWVQGLLLVVVVVLALPGRRRADDDDAADDAVFPDDADVAPSNRDVSP